MGIPTRPTGGPVPSAPEPVQSTPATEPDLDLPELDFSDLPNLENEAKEEDLSFLEGFEIEGESISFSEDEPLEELPNPEDDDSLDLPDFTAADSVSTTQQSQEIDFDEIDSILVDDDPDETQALPEFEETDGLSGFEETESLPDFDSAESADLQETEQFDPEGEDFEAEAFASPISKKSKTSQKAEPENDGDSEDDGEHKQKRRSPRTVKPPFKSASERLFKLLTRLPLIGSLFGRLLRFAGFLVSVLILIAIIAVPVGLFTIASATVKDPPILTFPDNGSALIKSPDFSKDSGKATATVENTGDVIAEVKPTLTVWSYSPGVNPKTWVTFNKIGVCESDYITVEIDGSKQISLDCKLDSNPGLFTKASGSLKY